MSDINEVLLKVKKLLALSGSPNEYEASLAYDKAHSLLKEYNLSLSDIKKDTLFDIQESCLFSAKNESRWKTIIIKGVAISNYCDSLKRNSVNGFEMFLVGKEHNIIVAKEMINYLIATVDRLSKNLIASERVSFKNGAAFRLYSRLKEINKMEQVQSTALVVQESKMVENYINSLSNVSNRELVVRNRSSVAYAQGYYRAGDISLNPQINSANPSNTRISQ